MAKQLRNMAIHKAEKYATEWCGDAIKRKLRLRQSKERNLERGRCDKLGKRG